MEHKYKKYKNKYIDLKNNNPSIKDTKCNVIFLKPIVFLTGRGGVGKSYVSNKLSKELQYKVISMDDIITKILIPKFYDKINKYSNGDIAQIFNIYMEKPNYDWVKKFKKPIIKIINDEIDNLKSKGFNKIVVEGSITDKKLIKNIFGKENKDYTLLLIEPLSKESYLEKVIKRFKEDPDNYGRLGFLLAYDEKNNGKVLKEYKIKGLKSPIVQKMFNTIGKTLYEKIIKKRKQFDGLDYVIYHN